MKNLFILFFLSFAAVYYATATNPAAALEQEQLTYTSLLLDFLKKLLSNGLDVNVKVHGDPELNSEGIRKPSKVEIELLGDKKKKSKGKTKKSSSKKSESLILDNFNVHVNLHPKEEADGFMINLDFTKHKESSKRSPDTHSSYLEMENAKVKQLELEECKHTLKKTKIANNASVIKESHSMKVNEVLCVEFENRVGTGYIWTLIGVYTNEPRVDTSAFPTSLDRIQAHVSEDIIVTKPKAQPSAPKPAETVQIVDEDGVTHELLVPQPTLVGGSNVATSKIKPLKAGTYFLLFAWYRSFDVDNAPNTRIIKLTVN